MRSAPRTMLCACASKKRRTNWKAKDNLCISVCPQTGQPHLRHRAYYVDGVLYYKGKILQNNQ